MTLNANEDEEETKHNSNINDLPIIESFRSPRFENFSI